MPFRTDLRVVFVDGRTWTLTEDLVYVTHRGETIIIPAGFKTDFASIPRVLWTLVGEPAGPWAPAAVVHDFLYRSGVVARSEADGIFRDACGDIHVNVIARWAFWVALRLAGWPAYKHPFAT